MRKKTRRPVTTRVISARQLLQRCYLEGQKGFFDRNYFLKKFSNFSMFKLFPVFVAKITQFRGKTFQEILSLHTNFTINMPLLAILRTKCFFSDKSNFYSKKQTS